MNELHALAQTSALHENQAIHYQVLLVTATVEIAKEMNLSNVMMEIYLTTMDAVLHDRLSQTINVFIQTTVVLIYATEILG